MKKLQFNAIIIMRKTVLFAALVAALALVSCNKDAGRASVEQPGLVSNELSFNTAASTVRGYVAGETFFDTAIAELHAGEDGAPSTVTTAREMKISSYLTPQSGAQGNYFVDYTFAKGEDGKWHHTPKIYWPIAGTLDFLAYSAMNDFDAKDVAWDEKNASEGVVLQVLEDRTQDDIVYASVSGRLSSTGAAAVPMEFKHAQAWLEFQIKVENADMKEKIAIEAIEIENIYNTGELTITNNSGDAKAEWNFRKEQRKNVVFDDNYNLYGSQDAEDFTLENALKDEISYMDMLLPEQAKTAFIIKYRLAGQPNELQYKYTLSSENWIAGNKYIYEVTFKVNEITVAPTVKAYEDGVVTDLTPSEII